MVCDSFQWAIFLLRGDGMRVAIDPFVRQIFSVLLKGHLNEEAHFNFFRRALYFGSTLAELPTRDRRP